MQNAPSFIPKGRALGYPSMASLEADLHVPQSEDRQLTFPNLKSEV